MNGFFINLSESIDRRHAIELQIQNLQLSNVLKRFNAIKSESKKKFLTQSVMGCLLSHLEIIRNPSNLNNLLILEDDVILSNLLPASLHKINKLLDETDIDIIFLGQTIPSNDITTHILMLNFLSKFGTSSKSITLIESKNIYRYGTFAYIINLKSIAKIRTLVSGIEFKDDTLPFDDFIATLINTNRIKSKIVFPYLVGLNPSHPSTLDDRENSNLHQSHCNLVNMYFRDHKMDDEAEYWRLMIDKKTNPYALKIAREIYEQIARSQN